MISSLLRHLRTWHGYWTTRGLLKRSVSPHVSNKYATLRKVKTLTLNGYFDIPFSNPPSQTNVDICILFLKLINNLLS